MATRPSSSSVSSSLSPARKRRIESRRRRPPGSFYWRPAAPDRFESRHCAAQGLEFEPDEKWNYSNSGYVLLGYLIEKISGKPYSQFVQENIFTPLGMKDLGYDSNSAIIGRRASGYSPSPKGPVNAGFIHMSIPFAAGSLYSTTEDLLLLEQGLFGGKLLSAASLQKMITPFKSDYAFGLGVRTVAGRKVIDHGGGIEGFNTHLAYYPDDKLTVVVLGNLNGAAHPRSWRIMPGHMNCRQLLAS